MTQNFWKSVRVQFTSGCSDAGSSKFRAPTVNPKLQRKPKPKEADCGEYNPKGSTIAQKPYTVWSLGPKSLNI